MESITLSNGVVMPQLGFGLLQIQDQMMCERCVLDALAAGYRLFDTAAAYLNEEAVGNALRASGVQRQQFHNSFFTCGFHMAIIETHLYTHNLRILGKNHSLCLFSLWDYYNAWFCYQWYVR